MARCVGDVDRFESHHWGRAPLLRRSERSEGSATFADVFSTGELDAFLASGIRRPVVRLVRDGSPLPGESYTSRVRLGGTDFRDVIAPERVAEHFGAGATVVAQSLHRTHPTVRAFVEQLGDEISHPIQANAYLTPPNATGLAPHADGHDVIVLQLEGSKHWTVESLGDVDLEPGDTLYVPAGYEHRATSSHRTSLHLTLGILRVTYRSVLQRALRNGPAVLDDPLPLRYRSSGNGIRPELEELLGEVQRYISSLDPAEIERTETERRTVRPPRSGDLSAAIALAGLDHQAELVRTGDPWTVTVMEEAETDSTIRVEAAGHWLSAPGSCAAAIEQLAYGAVARVGALIGLDDDSQLILARRMVGAGLCRIAER